MFSLCCVCFFCDAFALLNFYCCNCANKMHDDDDDKSSIGGPCSITKFKTNENRGRGGGPGPERHAPSQREVHGLEGKRI